MTNNNLKKDYKFTANELRESFLDYFKQKDHDIVESSSVVPFSDPSLLFTNSGMVQFKKNFLSEDDGTFITRLKRATSSQRCIRAGGKHNDLDDVGKDTYHHTFFEMMGNWSFGDYFKEEAIDYAFDFLVNVLKLKKENIYVSYFGGVQNFEDDYATKKIWEKYLPSCKILKFGMEDNFWEMGDTGPCGPCTEIHYDRIGNRDASHLVNKDDPNVIEIWNIVFMEFYRDSNGLSALKKKSVDTGMGLERVLGILNDGSNYQTDLFGDIFNEIGIEYKDSDSKLDTILRIVADHCRTVSVCLNYDVSFASEGRGYVLRRIMRRLILNYNNLFSAADTNNIHAKENINTDEMLKNLIVFSAKTLGIELKDSKITQIEKEISLFKSTLKKGTDYFLKLAEKNSENKTISGKDAFLLYDTYGFPIDLTVMMAEEKDFKVEMDKFEEMRKDARERSRKSKSAEMKITNNDLHKIEEFNKKLSEKNQQNYEEKLINLDEKTETYFETEKLVSDLIFVKSNSEIFFENFEEIKNEEIDDTNKILGVVTKKTNFYAEKGGQIGDEGIISFLGKNNEIVGTFSVKDVQYSNNFILHFGIVDGNISEKVIMEFDKLRRNKIRNNHSATHLLNSAIKKMHPESYQRGSLVAPERLRFDFYLNRNLTDSEIMEIENEVNSKILQKIDVSTKTSKFKEIGNDVALLKGENYPDNVRVVEMDHIKELCGGTHVKNTSNIELFRIISESSISANTRRIIAVTGKEALEAEKNYEDYLKDIEEKKCIVVENVVSLLKKKVLMEKNAEIQGEVMQIMKDFTSDNSEMIKERLDSSKKFTFEVKKSPKLDDKDNLKAFRNISKKLSKVIKKAECVTVLIYLHDNVYFQLFGNDCLKEVESIKKIDNSVIGGKNTLFTGYFSQKDAVEFDLKNL